MHSNNIVKGALASHKTNLLMTNKIRNNLFYPISKDFGNDFKTDIAQEDRSKIRNQLWIIFFGDEDDERFALADRQRGVFEKVKDSFEKMIPDDTP